MKCYLSSPKAIAFQDNTQAVICGAGVGGYRNVSKHPNPTKLYPQEGEDEDSTFGQCFLALSLFSFYNSLAEKATAPNSSTLAWKIPWAEEPGRLQSMGSLGVGHD